MFSCESPTESESESNLDETHTEHIISNYALEIIDNELMRN